MVNYSYVKPILKKFGKKASEYINWLLDERKSHKLPVMKGMEGIIFDRNGGGGSEIYINYELKDNFNKFINEHV